MRLTLIMLLTLTGCTGNQHYVRVLESEGVFTIQPVHAPDHDYAVHVKTRMDFGMDTNRKVDRNKLVLTAMRGECPNARIVGEDSFSQGNSLLGKPMRTYIVKVKC